MTLDEYLNRILDQQTLEKGSKELEDLRSRRDEVEGILRAGFPGSKPTIRYAGSKAKCTMIRNAYDLDLTCYFDHDDDGPGETLKAIYSATRDVLTPHYEIELKTSAIRLKGKKRRDDFHIDVVPGRFIKDSNDVFLHQNGGEKDRLQTNLDVHIEHIKGSGVTDAIRLLKLWKVQQVLPIRTFVLELLAVKLLKHHKSSSLETQLTHVWTKMRDHSEDLAVEDPANSGNDLKPLLEAVRAELRTSATLMLASIEKGEWEQVFGPVSEEKAARIEVLRAAAATVQTRPWLPRQP